MTAVTSLTSWMRTGSGEGQGPREDRLGSELLLSGRLLILSGTQVAWHKDSGWGRLVLAWGSFSLRTLVFQD